MSHRRALVAVLPCLVALVAACGDNGASEAGSSSAREGQRIARRSGCTACHGAAGQGGIGPPWGDSFGSEVDLADGTTVTVDEAYLSRAISDPSAQVRAGFDIAMPSNELTDEEIADVVAYIVELSTEGSG